MVKLYIIALALIFIGPTAYVVANGGASGEKSSTVPFRYADDRMGEKKDLSDKFMFVRIHFGPIYAGTRWGDGGLPWSHDYPEAGLHLRKILGEVSKTQVHNDINEYVFSFNDPNLCKYPFAYLCEVGYMDLSEDEIKGLREYLLRGGFLLVDDFGDGGRGGFRGGRGSGYQLQNLIEYVKRAFPEQEYQLKPIDPSHPIFNSFFSVNPAQLPPMRNYGGSPPEFYGLEDKAGRLMMMINYNYDVSDFWQWSNDPFQPIEDSNTAYKYGVNYIFYALTH